jgi:hypothetical protein
MLVDMAEKAYIAGLGRKKAAAYEASSERKREDGSMHKESRIEEKGEKGEVPTRGNAQRIPILAKISGIWLGPWGRPLRKTQGKPHDLSLT